jgi:hypothetical protein
MKLSLVLKKEDQTYEAVLDFLEGLSRNIQKKPDIRQGRERIWFD